MEEVKQFEKTVKLVRVNPDRVRPIFVNDVIITHTRSEFYLTFSVIEPPAFLEEQDIHDLEEIEATARVKLVVSSQFVESFLKALSTNVENYKDKQDEPDD